MKEFRILLSQLSDVLHDLKSPLTDIFQSGIGKLEVKILADKYDLNFPEEIYELYEWKNGINAEKAETKTIGELNLFNLGIFDSLETSLNAYKYYTENGYWEKGLFPLFSSGAGDFYLIDIVDKSTTYKKIYYFSPSDPDFSGIITIFDSIKDLFISILQCFTLGAYKYNSDNINKFLIVDYEIENNIFLNCNPKSDYWRLSKI